MFNSLPQLVRALDIRQFVPPAYAAYRPLVADALAFFLDNLPPVRSVEILRGQLALPSGARPEERLVAVMRCCPTLHKIGQLVSRDRRLAPDLRRQLQRLESLAPSRTAELWQDLPKDPDLAISPSPLAEASVAVVIPFTWRPPHAPEEEGVFKVLKPGIAERLHEELYVWPALGGFLEARCARYGLPQIPYRDTLDRVRQLLRSEIRPDIEQAHLAQAAQFYADARGVLIPRLLPFSTPRVTAMQRVNGRKVTDAALEPEGARALAKAIIEALVAKPFWNDAPATPFHADPHAGNLLLSPDGRLAILDWSLTGCLRKSDQVQLMQVVLAALSLDGVAMARAISALSRTPVGDVTLQSIVADALRRVRQGAVPGFQWLLRLLDALAASATVEFSEDLLFFRKALHSIAGVLADVCGDCTLEAGLLETGTRAFCRDFASRFLSPAGSHAFRTHVSTADLCWLWATWPVTAARYWAGMWEDALRPARPTEDTAGR